MEAITTGPRFITPTYQTMIINAALVVMDRFNEGVPIGEWNALENLYTILIPDIKKDVDDEYKSISNRLSVAERRVRASDPLLEHANQTDAIVKILRGHNRVFFEHIMLTLNRHGLIVKDWGPPTRVGGLDKIAERLG